jgi:hypothetical protein
LFCSVTPATAPTAIHTAPPSRSARTSSQDSAVQPSRSNVAVDVRWPTASSTDETAIDAAASSWTPRPPPNSRAISPVSSTTSPAASADGSRSPTRAPSKSRSIACTSNGVSGGWST